MAWLEGWSLPRFRRHDAAESRIPFAVVIVKAARLVAHRIELGAIVVNPNGPDRMSPCDIPRLTASIEFNGAVRSHPLTLGYVHDAKEAKWGRLGIGGDATFYRMPDNMLDYYGTSTHSFHVFIRYRPRSSDSKGKVH